MILRSALLRFRLRAYACGAPLLWSQDAAPQAAVAVPHARSAVIWQRPPRLKLICPQGIL